MKYSLSYAGRRNRFNGSSPVGDGRGEGDRSTSFSVPYSEKPSPHPDPLPSHPMGAEREQQSTVAVILRSRSSPRFIALQGFNILASAILLALSLFATSSVLGGDVTLEDNDLLISFDSASGALTRFENKDRHWVVERRPELGASFRLYAPLPTRRYNPVFGQKQHAAEVRKVSDHEISIRWENLVSENGGVLPMSFTVDITLTNGALTFASTLKNDSDLTVETIEYPCFGDLNPPSRDYSLTACTMKKGVWTLDELYPHFHNEKGYWGVTWPTKMLESPYCLIQTRDGGLSVGTPDRTDYRVQYVFEQHPGVISGVTAVVPPADETSGIPVHLEFRVCHFVFVGSHSTTNLAPVSLTFFRIAPI